MTYFKEIQHQLQTTDLERFLQLELISAISYYVEEHNIFYKELAEKAGVNEKDIYDLLEGCKPNTETISKLLKTLDLRINISLSKN